MSSAVFHTKARGSQRRMRVYEQWQGNERFFFWGHLVAGPNWKSAVGSSFLVLAPSVVFLIWPAPYLAKEVSYAFLVIGCIFSALSLSWLFMTACRDPGILPRQEPDEEYLAGRKPRTKEVLVNGHRVIIRYNDTCHFYQPPRAHHCSVNDNCIERFDHHCPWVGTTIGLRNYRTFLLFIYTTSVFCIYVFSSSLAAIIIKQNKLVAQYEAEGRSTSNLWAQAFSQSPAAIALVIYTFVFFWFVGGLSAFHAYLVGSNQTTYENFRYNHDSRPNPYNMGLWRNCGAIWCMRVPASRVDFRAYIDDYQRPPPPDIPYPPYVESVNESAGPTDMHSNSTMSNSYSGPAPGSGSFYANTAQQPINGSPATTVLPFNATRTGMSARAAIASPYSGAGKPLGNGSSAAASISLTQQSLRQAGGATAAGTPSIARGANPVPQNATAAGYVRPEGNNTGQFDSHRELVNRIYSNPDASVGAPHASARASSMPVDASACGPLADVHGSSFLAVNQASAPRYTTTASHIELEVGNNNNLAH